MVWEVIIVSTASSAAELDAADTFYSTDEIRRMLDALTDAELRRVASASRWLASDRRVLDADLRQEVYLRALDGRRKCRRKWNVVDFLIGIMRSLTSDEREADKAGNRTALVANLDDVVSSAPSPEQQAYDAMHYRNTLAAIDAALAQDSQLKILLDAMQDGLRGASLQRLLGVDATQLASLQRRLKRTIAGAVTNRSVP